MNPSPGHPYPLVAPPVAPMRCSGFADAVIKHFGG